MATTGHDLKVERVAAKVGASKLAARMGVARSTVWIIEKSADPTPLQVADYRRALATFKNVATPEAAA